MAKLNILVVDDDPLAQKVLSSHLSDHAVEFAKDAAGARKRLGEGKLDVCFIDLKLGASDKDCSGLTLIPVAAGKKVYSVVMSGHDSEEFVDKAYALGCDDFYSKGNEQAAVGTVIERFLRRRGASDQEKLFTERFVTEDPGTRAAITEALKYSGAALPIMILGPSGTGKTSLARLIHDLSARPGEFVAINCSAYTEELLEAELFGYKKGAFTGANENRKGKLLLADKGTLFLDEIGSMSLKMQTKLLKAIEEKSFYPLGSEKAESSDFRIVSATLEDVQALIRAGKLRFDFFQRVHGLTVPLKPLAERKGDVLPLVGLFTRGGKKLSFAPEAREELLKHDWPGNVRELKKVVDLLMAGDEGRVGAENVRRLLQSALTEEAPASGFVTDEQYRYALDRGLDAAVDRFVDTVIKRNLSHNGGKKTRVLDDLKISTRILYSSLKRQEPA
jgi:DNA-binding NtrC family response regulator